MKYIDWDELKNAKLKVERDISFEDVLSAIDEDRVLDSIAHPNQMLHEGQSMFVVEINHYAYLVPYVEDDVKIFLKTIIPSRKATKKYLKGEKL